MSAGASGPREPGAGGRPAGSPLRLGESSSRVSGSAAPVTRSASPVSRTSSRLAARLGGSARSAEAAGGLTLLAGLVAVMWVVEVINTLDSNRLDGDGIWARNFSRLWGVLTAPFIHASFAHLIANTIPFVFMGAIVALRGAARLASVTAVIIVLGGLGTWLISPGGGPTIGASGVVFGYATYLFARGFFNRSALELLTGLIVGAVWGGALLASLIPHAGVSWQGHLCGGVAGVVAAWGMARRPAGPGGTRARAGGAASGAGESSGSPVLPVTRD